MEFGAGTSAKPCIISVARLEKSASGAAFRAKKCNGQGAVFSFLLDLPTEGLDTLLTEHVRISEFNLALEVCNFLG